MQITLEDGTRLDVPSGTTPLELVERAGVDVEPVIAVVDGELWDLTRPLERDATVGFRDAQSEEGLYALRHSAAHVMAEAICRLWPDAKLAYGPPTENGFYYDIYLEEPISSDDFPRIQKEMQKIIAEKRPFTRVELPPEVAMDRLREEDNKYKLDNAERALEAGDGVLSFYVTGTPGENWEDLCRGPHVPHTGYIGAPKVMSVAASHWHGDVNSDQFQRVYGTAFRTKAELKEYLNRLEAAKQRDHRVVGQKLGLFTIDEQVGPGLILWKPRGGRLRQVLQDFLTGELVRRGYQVVFTPHIGKIDLYKTSGHYPFYADSQFPPISLEDGEQYLLKPMNCPHHIKIFASDHYSYRDLPIRLAEFGTVYRFEQSGELQGMTRVRGFTQDDAHIFCTPEQVRDEFRATVELVQFVFRTFGFDDVSIRLSLRDPNSDKYAGDPALWDRAERELREVLEDMGIDFRAEEGEAAFYGPKVDFVVRDVIGRRWQLGTVQLDYNLPERFGIQYIGADNQAHRPVMIHRAPFGSMERFVAILIEHYNGAFPYWLAPEQVRVLPVSDKHAEYAADLGRRLIDRGVRAETDLRSETLSKKIREAQKMKIPVMLIVGDQEVESGTASPRLRSGEQLDALDWAALLAFLDEQDRDSRGSV
ncbi:MAG: threonine--tRNA ligase [Candidatus Dadabacteria bacterium]|nr:MAG: threonine--tRNA ligase [Candidatus Dadabacteria bacterium]